MKKLTISGQRRGHVRRGLFVLLLVAFAASALSSMSGTLAQSGRRTPGGAKKAETVPVTPEEQGESESKPRAKSEQKNAPLVTFIVFESDDAFPDVDIFSRDLVIEGFMRRMREASSIEAKHSGKASRKTARDRAKNEKEAFVVLLHLEESSAISGQQGLGRPDPRTLVIKTFVYAPVSGDLRFTDRVEQRPYRPTATIGGIRVPTGTPRMERFPGQYQLEQAAHDAADRIMSKFNVLLPPRN
jgi:hypothetical protein